MKTYFLHSVLSSFLLIVLPNMLYANSDFSDCSAKGCHLEQKKHSVIHSPVEDDCLSCHETDSKKHPLKNEKEFTLIAEVRELCSECHDPMTEK